MLDLISSNRLVASTVEVSFFERLRPAPSPPSPALVQILHKQWVSPPDRFVRPSLPQGLSSSLVSYSPPEPDKPGEEEPLPSRDACKVGMQGLRGPASVSRDT